MMRSQPAGNIHAVDIESSFQRTMRAANASRIVIRILLLGVALASTPVRAGVEEGVAADDRGDFPVALAEFNHWAAAGHPSAMNKLGVMYARGAGVERSYSAALDWFFRAQALGSAEATMNLATMHEQGLGTPRDHTLALKYFRDAAVDGYQPAIVRMLRFYEQGGLGLAPDRNGVLYWQARLASAQQGDPLTPGIKAGPPSSIPAVEPPVPSSAPSVVLVPLKASAALRKLAAQPPAPVVTVKPGMAPLRAGRQDLLEEQVEQRLDQYQRREQKLYVGSNDGRPTVAPYLKALRARLKRHLAPVMARARPGSRLIVVLSIRHDGTVRAVELASGSGQTEQDAAVLASLRGLKRLAPLPKEIDRRFDLLEVAVRLPME